MNPVNHAPCHVTGIGQLDRLSQNTTNRPPPIPQQYGCQRCLNAAPPDGVRLSNPAQGHAAAWPIDPPQPGSRGGDSDLAAAVRKVGQFFKEHPRIEHSPFGKSVQTLMRGAVQLVMIGAAGDADGLSDEDQEKLKGAAIRVTEFLHLHHEATDSLLGQAVSELIKTILSAIEASGASPDVATKDRILEAAGRTQAYLETHPRIAEMPLGQVVERLIGGIQGAAEGNNIDFDSRNLARRVDYFVAQHPRLANSAFGHLVAAFTRGMIAVDAIVPPDGEPSVAGDAITDAAVPVASDTLPETKDLEEADLKEAA